MDTKETDLNTPVDPLVIQKPELPLKCPRCGTWTNHVVWPDDRVDLAECVTCWSNVAMGRWSIIALCVAISVIGTFLVLAISG